MELHVVAVRNLKEKKIDAFTNNHNFDTVIFPLSLQSTTETKTCEEKL